MWTCPRFLREPVAGRGPHQLKKSHLCAVHTKSSNSERIRQTRLRQPVHRHYAITSNANYQKTLIPLPVAFRYKDTVTKLRKPCAIASQP